MKRAHKATSDAPARARALALDPRHLAALIGGATVDDLARAGLARERDGAIEVTDAGRIVAALVTDPGALARAAARLAMAAAWPTFRATGFCGSATWPLRWLRELARSEGMGHLADAWVRREVTALRATEHAYHPACVTALCAAGDAARAGLAPLPPNHPGAAAQVVATLRALELARATWRHLGLTGPTDAELLSVAACACDWRPQAAQESPSACAEGCTCPCHRTEENR